MYCIMFEVVYKNLCNIKYLKMYMVRLRGIEIWGDFVDRNGSSCSLYWFEYVYC